MPKRKPTTRKITTVDGLVYALKQKVGESADLFVSQTNLAIVKPGRNSTYTSWSCDCKVTDADGYELEASVSGADTPNEVITKLMKELAKAAHEARRQTAAQHVLEDQTRSRRRIAEPRKPLLLGYNGK